MLVTLYHIPSNLPRYVLISEKSDSSCTLLYPELRLKRLWLQYEYFACVLIHDYKPNKKASMPRLIPHGYFVALRQPLLFVCSHGNPSRRLFSIKVERTYDVSPSVVARFQLPNILPGRHQRVEFSPNPTQGFGRAQKEQHQIRRLFK